MTGVVTRQDEKISNFRLQASVILLISASPFFVLNEQQNLTEVKKEKRRNAQGCSERATTPRVAMSHRSYTRADVHRAHDPKLKRQALKTPRIPFKCS